MLIIYQIQIKILEFSRDTNRGIEDNKKRRHFAWLHCNDFVAMASLQWLRSNCFSFSRSPIFTSKATVALDSKLK